VEWKRARGRLCHSSSNYLAAIERERVDLERDFEKVSDGGEELELRQTKDHFTVFLSVPWLTRFDGERHPFEVCVCLCESQRACLSFVDWGVW